MALKPLPRRRGGGASLTDRDHAPDRLSPEGRNLPVTDRPRGGAGFRGQALPGRNGGAWL